jgi:hypothetical protein
MPANEDSMKRVNYLGLKQSWHIRRLKPDGILTDEGKMCSINILAEEATDTPAAKPPATTEQNLVMSAIPCTIAPTQGYLSIVAYGSNDNRSGFIEGSQR